MKKATVIGHFGFKYKYSDGQTVKTKTITEALESHCGKDQIIKIDTHGGIKTLLKAPFQIFTALKKTENVIILPAYKGLLVYAPLLAFERMFFKRRKIHYVVIGGWLPKYLDKKKWLAKTLKRFDGIYVETKTMQSSLEEKGFHNVFVMPNCKFLPVLATEDLVYSTEQPYRICTFSRVMPEKGIEDIMRAVKNINEKRGSVVYSLDIYGPVDEKQADWFKKTSESFPEYVTYRGVVDFKKSVEVLKNYFALIFPTRFYTEGIPGTIIDAYAAGIPVISSKWKNFSDIVDDGVTGLGYDFDNRMGLEELLEKVNSCPEIISKMRCNCLEKAKEFSPQRVIKILTEQMN